MKENDDLLMAAYMSGFHDGKKLLSSSRMLDDVRALLSAIDALQDDIQTGEKSLFLAISGAKVFSAAEKVRAHVG